nr:hypothetical protein Iba_chr14fCG11910 [Ipomoea batatas]
MAVTLAAAARLEMKTGSHVVTFTAGSPVTRRSKNRTAVHEPGSASPLPRSGGGVFLSELTLLAMEVSRRSLIEVMSLTY